MKHSFIFIFLISCKILSAQEDQPVFDNQVKLKEGIYTSFSEVVENHPKYHDCAFETKGNFWTGKMSVYYYDKDGNKQLLKDTILIVVHEGKRYVKYKNRFCKLILAGAISTFMIETVRNNETQAKLYFLDLKTGVMDVLDAENVDYIMKRDRLIYLDFSTDEKKEKILYSYVLKFNKRNPVHIMLE